MFQKAKNTAVNTTTADKTQPYAVITGQGKKSYFVEIYRPDLYSYCSWTEKYFSSLGRAERWAERKLSQAKQHMEHQKYHQRITIN